MSFVEFRLVLRSLLRAPLFTVIATLTLALGIGAYTAIFSVVQCVLLDPLPFDDAERLVSLWHEAPGLGVQGPVHQSPATYLTYREEGTTFEDIGLWDNGSVAVTGLDLPEQVEALYITEGLLPILRVEPVLGRRFTREDDAPGSPRTVLLGHGYWTRRFGSDPEVVGDTLLVDGEARQILGVLPPGLRLVGREPALWLPFQLDPAEVFVGDFSYQALGRLKPGVTIQSARQDLARTLPMVVEKFPRGMTLENLRSMELAPTLVPLGEDVVGDVGRVLWILFGTVGIVLLIACANVANLFLARAEGKQREVALRAALGAGRLRLLGGRLTECGVVALTGGVVGLSLAYMGTRLLAVIGSESLPRLHSLRIDSASAALALGLSLATALALSLLPSSRSNSASLGAGRGGGASRNERRARAALVVAQLALAMVLLVGAGLMVRSFRALHRVDPGFEDPDSVLTLRIEVPEAEVEDPVEVAATHERIQRAIETIPGVDSVGLSSSITMDGWNSADGVHVEDFPTPAGEMNRIHRFKWISEGYFETMGNPMRAGRGITWADVHEMAKTVVVTEDFATSYWGAPELALGKRIRQGPDEAWSEIVGIVGNVHDDGLGVTTTSTVFWPLLVSDFWDREVFTQRNMGYAIRTTRLASPGLLGELRSAVASVNPNLPIASVLTLEEIVAKSTARTSFTLTILGIAALAALLLGVIGIYGVVSYQTARRTREIGVRMALGARRRDVRRLILGQGALLTAAGLALGLVGALGLSQMLGALLYGVAPHDFVTYGAVSLLLAGISLASCYLPARRASSIEPTVALRWE